MSKVIGFLLSVVVIIGATMIVLSCQKESPEQPGNQLAGTVWRLAEFQSMDDAVGTIRPDNPSDYTMQLNDDSTATMRLNCNRANGSWSANHAPDHWEM